jgi:hypothetical protein
VRVRWVELLNGTGARLVFRQGAAQGRLDELERRLGATLPSDLRDLLSETDGFDNADGQWEVAWSVGRVGSETEQFRSDGLLGHDDVAFGDNGAGDPFCIDVAGTVSVVSPVTRERVLLAESLSDFWDGWFRRSHHHLAAARRTWRLVGSTSAAGLRHPDLPVWDGLRMSERSTRSYRAEVDPRWLGWRTRRRVPASEVPVTSQAIYDCLVKDCLSPRFRQLGLTGSSGRYSLRCERCWVLMGLQKSRYSDAAEVQFTMNLLVVNKALWASTRASRPYLAERPAPSALYGDPVAQTRIGSLLPGGEDKWWRVFDGVDVGAVANDVFTETEGYALPWLHARMDEHNCT